MSDFHDISCAKCHVVIVGGGMAGSKLAHDLLQIDKMGGSQITLIGEEPQVGYNRIMLSSLLAQEISQEDMKLVDTEDMVKNGAHILSGDPVEGVLLDEKCVQLSSGQVIHYDKLVFATGSRSTILPIEGVFAENVIGFRDWKDVDTMSGMPEKQPVCIVGGGLLGLEAAVGLIKRGHKVTLFHRSNWLLNRQLDEESAQLLLSRLESMGIVFRLGESPKQFLQNELGRVTDVLCQNGETIPTNLVVMAAGITPEISLAKCAGLETGKAILVNSRMETSHPDVFAIGECCEFNQHTFGLVAPIWSQIKVLVNVLLGEHAGFSVEPVPTKLKVSGVNLFSVGKIQPTENDTCILFRDTHANHYRKLVVNDGILVGAILYGNVADGSWYFQLIQNKTNVSDMLDLLVFGEAYCQSVT